MVPKKKQEIVNTKQDPHLKEYIEGWKNNFDYEQKKRERNAKEQSYPENYNEIAQLKESYSREIALYEEKITALMLLNEQQAAKIRKMQPDVRFGLESNK